MKSMAVTNRQEGPHTPGFMDVQNAHSEDSYVKRPQGNQAAAAPGCPLRTQTSYKTTPAQRILANHGTPSFASSSRPRRHSS